MSRLAEFRALEQQLAALPSSNLSKVMTALGVKSSLRKSCVIC